MVAVALVLLLLQMIQQGTNNVYPEVEGLSILLNFKTQNAGCCKVGPGSAGFCSADKCLIMCCSWFCRPFAAAMAHIVLGSDTSCCCKRAGAQTHLSCRILTALLTACITIWLCVVVYRHSAKLPSMSGDGCYTRTFTSLMRPFQSLKPYPSITDMLSVHLLSQIVLHPRWGSAVYPATALSAQHIRRACM
jgi:hypothetical protein